jgi:fatty acid desaturase
MWWGILTVVVVVVLAVAWLVLQHQTDLLGRSRRHEDTDPEVARALRGARRDIDRGNQYPHGGF